MTEHGEHNVSDWRHVAVAPPANTPLLGVSSLDGTPELETRWRSELRQPERFSVLTPTQLSPKLGPNESRGDWRAWLNERYGT